MEQGSKCPEIIDQFGTRPGRKRGEKKDPNKLKCDICNGSHTTTRCPYKEEMKAFAPPDSTKEGSRHCSLCDYSGYNAASCPTKKDWLEHRISNVSRGKILNFFYIYSKTQNNCHFLAYHL